ncbi:hypothetical protein COZ78_03625 [bacterium (Candidatus Gribaldobacteria) CG_4_8_14_3_um_filter_42_11]|uniref:Xylose isomerase-like TIM barrel domain-containing protein n=1 Tax=bacterium (Candidatus Gribaldobacteria) CG_4_8_14_3_um_filter_42_11 TaxID=2014267 RepID=A0A2M7IXD5_9BACT|nr:MAG: hypothetical protein COZ78_03625 [bacterium (Candidatus Gribaldobacteria) CG_4_8_14_3_um_filter_42_11]
MANKKILPGLTTITPGEWKNKVKEIDELGLKEIALFPTCLDYKARHELYHLLEKTGLSSILHVHLREEDFEAEELYYLINRFKTQVFNVHPTLRTMEFLKRNKKYKNQIFLENLESLPENFSEILELCGGVCLDLSHWEGHGILEGQDGYAGLPKLLKKYKIGCNHISAVKKEREHCYEEFSGINFYSYNSHYLNDFSEIDYVKKYKKYLADIISIELENPLKRQLEVKSYLEKIIF